MKTKIKIEDLKIQSFSTSGMKKIEGGIPTDWYDTDPHCSNWSPTDNCCNYTGYVDCGTNSCGTDYGAPGCYTEPGTPGC